MFELFTDRARRSLVLAQEEARLTSSEVIGTGHLLLGLIHDGDGVAAEALESLGATYSVVRDKASELIAPGGGDATGSPPFSRRATAVLELARRDSAAQGHDYIRPEHLLLALIREGEGVGVDILVSLGVDLSRLRELLLAPLEDQPAQAGSQDRVERPRPKAAIGPICPSCGTPLAGNLGYRTLSAEPVDNAENADTLPVTIVHCLTCGVAIPHSAQP